ncbi:MAG: tRNA lysidine(34) synthetase TilS [Anaerolineaceae bacterium]|nr:tRNA lysidine(34) synthetase TilS [Anaerolineaceae bacterium]
MLVNTHAIISQMDLFDILQKFSEKICPDLWNDGLVIGVSGGPDSLALLHILSRFDTLPPQTIVAHLDHELRNSSSKDGQFVTQIAQDWGFHVVVDNQNIKKLASKHKLSLEDAGRKARYTLFKRIADTHNIKLILVGHNADDQVETILMNFVRGSGLSGLSGMSPITPIFPSMLTIATYENSDIFIGRPLLSVSRQDIQEYCRDNNLSPLQDPSNNDKRYLRNRIRHEIIPVLKDINPNINQTTGHISTILQNDQLVLQQANKSAWNNIVTYFDDQKIVMNRAMFGQALAGTQLAILRLAIKHLRPKLRNIDFNPISYAAKFSKVGDVRQECSLPGNLVMKIDYQDLLIVEAGMETECLTDLPFLANGETITIDAPGSIALESCGWKILVDFPEKIHWKSVYNNADRWKAYIDCDTLEHQTLQLRSRRPGDKFQPLGMHGKSQSLAHYMTNARIPYELRNRIPLLVSGERIIWIAGWRLDQRACISQNTQNIMRVRMDCSQSLANR